MASRRQPDGVGWLLLTGLLLGSCGATRPTDATDATEVVAEAVVEFDVDKCRGLAHQRAIGVLIDEDLVATVSHAFLDADGAVSVEAFEVIGAAGQRLSGDIVYLDPATDVALVRIEGLSAQPLAFADAEEGDTVRFITRRDEAQDGEGDGGRDGQTTTVVVVVAATVRQATTLTLDGSGARAGLELGAAIELGDSGAPVLDDEHRVIGIVFAASRAEEAGWAIAASEYQQAINESARLPLEGGPILIGC